MPTTPTPGSAICVACQPCAGPFEAPGLGPLGIRSGRRSDRGTGGPHLRKPVGLGLTNQEVGLMSHDLQSIKQIDPVPKKTVNNPPKETKVRGPTRVPLAQ